MGYCKEFKVKLGVKIFITVICCSILLLNPFLYGSVKNDVFYLCLLIILNGIIIYCMCWINRYLIVVNEESIFRRRVFLTTKIAFSTITKLKFKEKELIISSKSKKMRLHADLKDLDELIDFISFKVRNDESIIIKKELK